MSSDDFPFYRRSSFFAAVIGIHVTSWVAWILLAEFYRERGMQLGSWLVGLSAVGIVVLCTITLTGPVYLRDRQGRWWKTGWLDKVAAAVIGFFYLGVLTQAVLTLVQEFSADGGGW